MKWFKGMWHNSCNHYESAMPAPTRPAPPMPECEPSKADISEPVITLLEELKKDVWQASREEDSSVWSLTHNTRPVVLFISFNFYEGGHYLSNADWMTGAEKDTVLKAAKLTLSKITTLATTLKKAKERAEFAKRIGAPQ